MDTVILASKPRTITGKKLISLRAQGQVPGVVYGQGKEATAIQVNAKELDKIYHQAGTSRLVELKIAEQAVNVLFHDVQVNPITQQIEHFDLYTVKMDEKIKTEIPLRFTGEAPAVHELNAILVKNLEEIEVETLPGNLPENFEVNLDVLKEIGQSITVGDLKAPEGVTILVEPEEMIVKTDPPRSEEELEELDEEVAEGAEAEVDSEHGGDSDEGEAGDKTDEDAGSGKDGVKEGDKTEK